MTGVEKAEAEFEETLLADGAHLEVGEGDGDVDVGFEAHCYSYVLIIIVMGIIFTI